MNGKKVDLSQCIEAPHLDSKGYGVLTHKHNGKTINLLAHRLSYALFVGGLIRFRMRLRRRESKLSLKVCLR